MNFLDYLIYWIGKHSKRYRKLYWMQTGGGWIWGAILFIEDKLPLRRYNNDITTIDLHNFLKAIE